MIRPGSLPAFRTWSQQRPSGRSVRWESPDTLPVAHPDLVLTPPLSTTGTIAVETKPLWSASSAIAVRRWRQVSPDRLDPRWA